MARDIEIDPLAVEAGGRFADTFVIRFAYPDPAKAQRVASDLVARMMVANLQRATARPALNLQVLDPADLPSRPASPNRKMFATIGLVAGCALSAIVVAIRRRTMTRSLD